MNAQPSHRDLYPILRLFFAGRRAALIAGMLVASVTVIAGILLLGLSGWFITATAIAGLTSATAFAFDVFAPAAGIRFLAIIRTGSRYLERLLTHDTTLRILAELRETLFRAWARPQAATLLLKRPARLLFRLTADIDALDSLYLRVVVPLAAAIITPVLVGFALYFLHPLLAAAIFIILVSATLIILGKTARRSARPMRQRLKGTEALRARAIDLVAGNTDLLMGERMPGQIAALARADHYIADADRQLNRIDIRSAACFSVLHSSLLASSLIAVGLLVQKQAISVPFAAFGLLLILAILEPFLALRRGAMELSRTIIAARRLAPQLSAKPVPPRSASLPPLQLSADLADITLIHAGGTQPVLRNINLAIGANEKLALVGASGAGKSSLLALLSGELPAQTGQLSVVPATLLTQRSELFQDSLRDNLQLARGDASDRELMVALDQAGLSELMRDLPEGLDTRLGEGGLGLSGGQARRLTLARLFLTRTRLWLLDEPTEGLDEQTAADVLCRMRDGLAEHSMVLATHIRREAEICDRIIVIKQGTIVQSAEKGSARYNEILSSLR